MFSWIYRNICVILGHKSMKLMDDNIKFSVILSFAVGADRFNYEFRLESCELKTQPSR